MNNNGLIDINILEDYLDGKLDGKMMHQVEKLSLEDPFVADALAGLSQSIERKQSLSLLQKRLYERVAEKPITDKRWKITSQRLSIASAAAVLFIVVSVLFWMKENSRRQIEANQAKNVKIEIAPKDQLQGDIKLSTPVKVAVDEALKDAKITTYAGIKKVKVKPVEDLAVAASVSELTAESQPEVMTTPTSAARMSTAKVSVVEPLGGWLKFEEYILKNNKFVKNNQLLGTAVQLSFVIDQNNRPTTIKVVNGLTKEQNIEAIRLLTDGPDWKYMPNVSEAVIVNIKF